MDKDSPFALLAGLHDFPTTTAPTSRPPLSAPSSTSTRIAASPAHGPGPGPGKARSYRFPASFPSSPSPRLPLLSTPSPPLSSLVPPPSAPPSLPQQISRAPLPSSSSSSPSPSPSPPRSPPHSPSHSPPSPPHSLPSPSLSPPHSSSTSPTSSDATYSAQVRDGMLRALQASPSPSPSSAAPSPSPSPSSDDADADAAPQPPPGSSTVKMSRETSREISREDRAVEGAPPPTKSLRLGHGSRLRVLIVDDNALNLRVLRQILLKKLPHLLAPSSLRTASSGPEALGLLGEERYDLVLLDISMPGMSGLEVCRRLREGVGAVGGAGELGTGAEKGSGSEKREEDGERAREHNRGIDVCAVTTDLADWQVDMYRRSGMNGCIGKPLKEPDLAYALQLSMLTSSPLSFPSPAYSVSSSSSDSSTSSSSVSSSASFWSANNRRLIAPHVNSGRAKYPFYFRRHGQDQPLPASTSASYPSPASASGGSARSSSRPPPPPTRSRRVSLAPPDGPERMGSTDSARTVVPDRKQEEGEGEEGERPEYARATSYGSATTDGSSLDTADAPTHFPTDVVGAGYTPAHPYGKGKVEEREGKEDGVKVEMVERNPFETTFRSAIVEGGAWASASEALAQAVQDLDLSPDSTPSPQALLAPAPPSPAYLSADPAWLEVADPCLTAPPGGRPQAPLMSGFFDSIARQPTVAASPVDHVAQTSPYGALRGAGEEGPSNAMRQLLARRSQPTLLLDQGRAYTFDDSFSLGDHGVDFRVGGGGFGVRKGRGRRRSEAGEAPRPTWQLVALGKEQSVLKEGPLLSEVLEVLDREDRKSSSAAAAPDVRGC